MNDPELIQRLRGLDAPASPDPAFADTLFATLNTEAASRRIGVRRQSRTVLAFAASAAVVLVAAVLAIGLLFGGLPGPAAPTVAPVVTPWTSPATSPSTSPARSATSAATGSPSAVRGWRSGAEPPIGTVPNIVGVRDGEVWIMGPTDESLQSTVPEYRLHGYDVSANDWTDRGPAPPALGWVVFDGENEILLFGHSGTERTLWRAGSDTPDPTPGQPEEAEFWGRPQGALDGRFYTFETIGPSLSTAVTLVAYDPDSDQFSNAPPMQTSRLRPVLAIDPAGGIYVIGGWTVDDVDGEPLRSVERFDPATGTWSAAPELPAGSAVGGTRFGHAATFGLDGALYVFSYISAEPAAASDLGQTFVYRLDPATDAWTVVEPPPTPFEPHDVVLTDDGSVVLLGHVGSVDLDEPATLIWLPEE